MIFWLIRLFNLIIGFYKEIIQRNEKLSQGAALIAPINTRYPLYRYLPGKQSSGSSNLLRYKVKHIPCK